MEQADEIEDKIEAFRDKIEDEAADTSRQHTYNWTRAQRVYPTADPGQVATPPSTYLYGGSASGSKASGSGSSGQQAGPSRYAGGAFVVGKPTQRFEVDDSMATVVHAEQPEAQAMMTAPAGAYIPPTGVDENDYVEDTEQVIPPQQAAAGVSYRDHGPHVHGPHGHSSHEHHRSHRHQHSQEHRSASSHGWQKSSSHKKEVHEEGCGCGHCTVM